MENYAGHQLRPSRRREVRLCLWFNDTSIISPRQIITVSPIVEDFCDDSEVEGIKRAAQGKALYAWGIFTYEDTARSLIS
jgi:hypothetical protein